MSPCRVETLKLNVWDTINQIFDEYVDYDGFSWLKDKKCKMHQFDGLLSVCPSWSHQVQNMEIKENKIYAVKLCVYGSIKDNEEYGKY